MKIAFLNDGIYGYACSDASAVGGSERQQWLLARALASSGWTVVSGSRQDLRSGERRTIERVEFQWHQARAVSARLVSVSYHQHVPTGCIGEEPLIY